jgi:hypothetical protein
MSRAVDAYIEFKNTDKQIKAPYVIYSDFECLTMPVQKCTWDPSKSATEAYQTQVPSGFTVYVTRPSKFVKPIEYRGKDCINKSFKFIEVIKGLEKQIVAKSAQSNCPMKALVPSNR